MSDYSKKLLDPRWQKKRLKILERDNWTCQCCSSTEYQLQVHHLSYGKDPWDIEDDQLITYCKHCHSLIEECKTLSPSVIIHGAFVKKYLQCDDINFFFTCSDVSSKNIFIAIFKMVNGELIDVSGINKSDFEKISDFFLNK